jgi:hypothetical protein
MATVEMKEPRTGKAVKKAELLRPGASVTFVALTPEAPPAMAVLRWTNPEGKSKVVALEGIQVALEELALVANEQAGAARWGLSGTAGAGGGRQQIVHSCRHRPPSAASRQKF